MNLLFKTYKSLQNKITQGMSKIKRKLNQDQQLIIDQKCFFDINLTDVNSIDLHEGISRKLNIKYLDNVQLKKQYSQSVNGIIWGPNFRLFVPLLVQFQETQIKQVIFLVETGSPYTYLCQEVLDAFQVPTVETTCTALINGIVAQHIRLSTGHFSEMNLLGGDYLTFINAFIKINYKDYKFEINFNK